MIKVWDSSRKTFVLYAVSQPFELSGRIVVLVGSEPTQTIYLCKSEERVEVANCLQDINGKISWFYLMNIFEAGLNKIEERNE